MKERDFKKWREVRKSGERKYILQTGMLQWGGMMFVAFFVMYTVQNPDRVVFNFILNIIVWSIGGFFVGKLTWRFSEKSYQRYLQENGTDEI